MGFFDFISSAISNKQVEINEAKERAYNENLENLFKIISGNRNVSWCKSYSQKSAVCMVINKRLQDKNEVSDSNLEYHYNLYKKRNAFVAKMIGKELVNRGMYEEKEPGIFIRR